MRFALLGLDDELLRVAAAAVADGHVLGHVCEAEKFSDPVRRLAPGVQFVPHAETLLAGETPDCLLVGTGLPDLVVDDPGAPADRRGEQLRRFAQEGIPLTLLPFACDLDQGYEIEMYRREQNGVVRLWHWDWNHFGYRWLQALLKGEEATKLGEIQQIRWDACFSNRSRESVQARFAADVAQLRRWMGPIERVLATGAGKETHYDPFAPKGDLPPLDQLTVHLGSEAHSAVWSVVPGTEQQQARITLVGTAGDATLLVGCRAQEWRGILRSGNDVEELSFPAATIPWRSYVTPGDEVLPSWLDSCRDMEVIEAIDRSLIRGGRTVGVHAEETSEAEAFKGVMASGGCVMLSLVLFAFCTVLLVEGLRLPIREWFLWRAWPTVLIALILVFLAMQSLHVLVKKREN